MRAKRQHSVRSLANPLDCAKNTTPMLKKRNKNNNKTHRLHQALYSSLQPDIRRYRHDQRRLTAYLVYIYQNRRSIKPTTDWNVYVALNEYICFQE